MFLIFPLVIEGQMNHNIDSLLIMLKTSTDTQSIDILNTLALIYSDSSAENTIGYASRAREISKKMGDKEREAISLKWIGIGNYEKGDYPSAIANFKRSLNIQDSLANNDEILVLLNQIGSAYKNYGDYKTGIEYLIMASRKQDELHDSLGLAMSYANIGNIFKTIESNQMALDYYTKCQKLVEKLQHPYGMALSYMNIGMINKDMMLYDNAVENYQKAIKIFSDIQAIDGLVASYGNLSEVLSEQGKFQEANLVLNKTEALLKENKMKSQLLEVYLMYGKNFKKMGKYSEAIEYLNNALKEAEQTKQIAKQKEVYDELAEVWAETNNFKKAFHYKNKFYRISDSIGDIETRKAISEIQTKYETEKKEIENILLKNENKIKTLKLESRNKTIIWLSLGVMLFALLITIILILYRKKNKAYNHLVKQNLFLAKMEYNILKPSQETKGTDFVKETASEESHLVKKLEDFMLEEKPFLYGAITLDEIAKRMAINRSYLSKTINEHFGKNFNEFINEYRIMIARQLLTDPSKNHFSIEGIGQMAGFNSKSTFYSCFKKSTGLTPSYYRKSVSKIIP
jgi:AraC-like DNA-binding protein